MSRHESIQLAELRHATAHHADCLVAALRLLSDDKPFAAVRAINAAVAELLKVSIRHAREDGHHAQADAAERMMREAEGMAKGGAR